MEAYKLVVTVKIPYLCTYKENINPNINPNLGKPQVKP